MMKNKLARYIRLQLCLYSLALCMPYTLWAQQRKDTITGKVHAIPDVVVKGRRTPNKITTATPIQTFSKKDIDQLAISDIADAIRRFAGTNVKDYGGIGGLKRYRPT